MIVARGMTYRLYPTQTQAEALSRFAGTCRAVYNAALEQRTHYWRPFLRAHGKHISFASQGRELTQLRASFDWIEACPIDCQQQALRDLDQAFTNFFAGRAGYPRPRRKHANVSIRFPSCRLTVKRLNRRNATIRVPKLGRIRFRLSRPLQGHVANATISRDPLGWRVTFVTHVEIDTPPAADRIVGIDRGVTCSTATSDGEMPFFPREAITVSEAKARAHQLTASKRCNGSHRRAKALKFAARQRARAARQRKHANHVETTRIARRYHTVVLEDLRIKNMTRTARGTLEEPGRNIKQKAKLNRSILDTGWGQYETLLTYKVAERAGTLILVPARNTSRRCPECGHVSARNRETQALFRCVECGHKAHADVNAAINILRAGTRPSRGESSARKSRAAPAT
ncbi:RNA-guided endonuclease InsQ/TnpB family protein [Microvirga tunisiensis]|uniref:Transposase n=1 Tax=Microvirga tunisiensis TaxID=2108360 RepID=A0A5N7MB04_9HYPH|nr:RNA-guided endonuclease TnpB family protein [Microvirga tunisiensis]MPR06307.1 transposase [Microvirga tunisiensis]MPR24093.1 transposase [Microvirga tunisiensis]